MTRSKGLILLLFLCALVIPVLRINAIPTYYGGGIDNNDTWRRLLFLNTTIFGSSGDFWHYPWESENIKGLADEGVLINFRINWWDRFSNGELAWNTSVVDFYYNSTLMELLEEEIDWSLNFLDLDKTWAITLSEEGPGAAYRHFWKIEKFEKYNSTYHSETGFWLKPRYTLNKTESIVLDEWLNQKNNWFNNYLYDYIKGKNPDIQVFQFIFLYPGAIPVWGGGGELSGLRADGHLGDLYYYDVYLNPFWLYEYIRLYKTTYPDTPYHIYLWGEEPWTVAGLAGGFEHARRNAWITYLGGADAIAWFNWHYELEWMWGREDALGKRMIAYTTKLNAELEKLPVFKSKPDVLVIRDQPISVQLGLCSELGLFNEWDTISQKALIAEQPDLSQYKLIVASEDVYLSETVETLNQYVRDGGNLVLLGGFGWEQENYYYNGSRTRFLNEVGITQQHIWGDILIEIDESNLLDLSLSYEHLSSSLLGIPTSQLTSNHDSIGVFSFMDSGNLIDDVNPLVFYHNEENPNEGSILYWGVPKSNSHPLPEYEDVVESFIDEMNYTRYLYRTITRAYAVNYLGMSGSLAKKGEENLIITQAQIEEDVILAGISNFNEYSMEIQYSLDLDRFDFEYGTYDIYSLDKGSILGEITTDENIITISVEVEPQATRLLWITKENPPDYSIEIFPVVPSDEDVEDFWPVEAEPIPEPEPEPEPEPQPEPEPDQPEVEEGEPWIPGYPVTALTLAIILYTVIRKQWYRQAF